MLHRLLHDCSLVYFGMKCSSKLLTTERKWPPKLTPLTSSKDDTCEFTDNCIELYTTPCFGLWGLSWLLFHKSAIGGMKSLTPKVLRILQDLRCSIDFLPIGLVFDGCPLAFWKPATPMALPRPSDDEALCRWKVMRPMGAGELETMWLSMFSRYIYIIIYIIQTQTHTHIYK